MFQRIKDAIAFEYEFARWEQLSDVRTLLMGNRVAEMFGQSASYGKGVDVYLLRGLYERLRPEAIRAGKQNGLSSRQATIRFLCFLGDAYMKECGLQKPPDEFLFRLSMIAPINPEPGTLLPDRWAVWLAEESARSRKYFQEQRSAAPIIAAARDEAAKLHRECVARLDDFPYNQELLKVWRSVPGNTPMTEREIAEASGLSLSDTIAWLSALQTRGVVTVIGTALPEPRYWKTPLSTLKNETRGLRDKLDTYA